MSAGRSVDVVIAVHDVSRPIRRAVGSVLSAGVTTSAMVVAHGLPSEAIEDQLVGLESTRISVRSFSDGIRSAAGPFNHGLEQSKADWVTVLGSDDWFEEGAIDAMLALASESGAQIVFAPLRHDDGRRVLAPLRRSRRQLRLDPVKDRVFYRTAPLALISRDMVRDADLRFQPQYRTADDLDFGLRAFGSGTVMSYRPEDPSYVIGAGARQRTSTSVVDLRDTLAAIRDVLDGAWLAQQPARLRRSAAVKLLRIHVLDAVRRRVSQAEPVDADERAIVSDILALARRAHPAVLAPFSITDRRCLEQTARATDDSEFRVAVTDAQSGRRFASTFTRNPVRNLDRESTLMRYCAYAREHRR